MKLLLCKNCTSIFNLEYKEKTCSCGSTKGKYNDNLNAVYEGKHAIPLGIDNHSFIYALNNQPQEGRGERFTAFVIPIECSTFQKIGKR